MRFMLGFIAGALVKVWPWQAILQGEPSWYLPNKYELVTGSDPMSLISGLALVSGALIVVVMQMKSRSDGLSRR